jgi:hypothetical protein
MMGQFPILFEFHRDRACEGELTVMIKAPEFKGRISVLFKSSLIEPNKAFCTICGFRFGKPSPSERLTKKSNVVTPFEEITWRNSSLLVRRSVLYVRSFGSSLPLG